MHQPHNYNLFYHIKKVQPHASKSLDGTATYWLLLRLSIVFKPNVYVN